jgi:E3 ubiquitin-protein ligase RGLG
MGASSGAKAKKKGSGFSTIADRFHTFAELQEGLRHAGLESSNLVVGVDFTKVFSLLLLSLCFS